MKQIIVTHLNVTDDIALTSDEIIELQQSLSVEVECVKVRLIFNAKKTKHMMYNCNTI